jgi:hypothetical protein
MTNMSMNVFASRFLAGDFVSTDVKTQCEAGWYDWFCRDTSLANKTKSLGTKVLRLMKSSKINPETQYVWFKNNCPMNGSLYDDFRIADLETGDVLYTVVPASGHNATLGRAEVWGRENDFKGPLVVGSWKDVKNFFGVK